MVGVSGPAWKFHPREALRLLVGLAIGMAASGALIATILPAASYALSVPLSASVREELAMVIGTLLAVADLTGHTPQVARQVPQRFARELLPGRRGLAWGVDLGLLVTTRKSSSLIWFALIGAVVMGPPSVAAYAVLVCFGIYVLGLLVLTLAAAPMANLRLLGIGDAAFARTLSVASGILILAIVIINLLTMIR